MARNYSLKSHHQQKKEKEPTVETWKSDAKKRSATAETPNVPKKLKSNSNTSDGSGKVVTLKI